MLSSDELVDAGAAAAAVTPPPAALRSTGGRPQTVMLSSDSASAPPQPRPAVSQPQNPPPHVQAQPGYAQQVPQQAPPGNAGAKIGIAVAIVGCLVLSVPVIGIMAAIAIPNFVSMQYKSKRAEVPSNLKGIKTAQLAYEANFDTFVAASAYPGYPTKTTQRWVMSESGGFASMGWSPDGDVRGSYWVETTNYNFRAFGISDVDGDGSYATYVATKSQNPNAPITGPDVY